MTYELKREAPPSAPIDWERIAAELRDEPLTWFKLDAYPPSTKRTLIRKGQPSAFAPAGSFDATIAKGALYLRYLGDPIEPWYPHMGDARAFDDLERELPA
jgi:hypothetical protein